MTNPPRFVFFGTSYFAVTILATLLEKGVRPHCIVTTPDKPQGRHLQLTPSPVKQWAEANGIAVLQPEKLKTPPFADVLRDINAQTPIDVFVVASYGKIIPEDIITLPPHGTLNVHPSLLPRYRGASPVQSTILNDDKKTGVTIISIDSEMDHGPIVAQQEVTLNPWPQSTEEMKQSLAIIGTELLLRLFLQMKDGPLRSRMQEHAFATYTKKFDKSDGLLDLTANPYQAYLRYLALKKTPGVYFIDSHKEKEIRVKVTKASYHNEQFVVERVVPEGRKEMSFEEYRRGKRLPVQTISKESE